MSIPVTIKNLMQGGTVEYARIEYKAGWNPDATVKTICAFANDLDNWGGGYIVIGVEECDGVPVHPVKGLEDEEIDHIQKDILRYCKMISPSYIPQSEPVSYEGKNVLVLWCPGGYDRPYRCPQKPTKKGSKSVYYIRKLASTIEATDIDFKELLALAHNVPFDDRINPKGEMQDLKYPLIKGYLEEVRSSLLEGLEARNMHDVAADMRIADGPQENFKPLNVGLMFFNDDPERFFPYSRIEVVNIPDPTGQGMEERIFRGPLDRQLKDALLYLKNNVIAQRTYKISGQATAVTVWNYSYDAIEEFVSNAIYHRSYQIHEPVTIRIERDRMEITSVPGPDRSISDDDIANLRMRSRRYRNRRVGDFLKELHLVEGRNTGIPTALRAIRDNGSPLPVFLTDEDRSFFSVIIPIHQAFLSQGRSGGSFADNDVGETRPKRIRRGKKEIKHLILDSLGQEGDLSENQLYHSLGYSGTRSKTFKKCIGELLGERKIRYTAEKTLTIS